MARTPPTMKAFRKRPKQDDEVGEALANSAAREKALAVFLKSCKKHTEAQKALEAAEQRLKTVWGSEDTTTDSVAQFNIASAELCTLGPKQQDVMRQCMTDSLRTYTKLFPHVAAAESNHKRATKGLKQAKEKVNKYMSKGAAVDPEKLTKAQQHVVEAEALELDTRDIIVQGVPKINDKWVEYMQPCLDAVIASHVLSTHRCEAAILAGADLPTRNVAADADEDAYTKETERMIAQMDKISVVGSIK